jgi:hypothetical protein
MGPDHRVVADVHASEHRGADPDDHSVSDDGPSRAEITVSSAHPVRDQPQYGSRSPCRVPARAAVRNRHLCALINNSANALLRFT